MNTQILKTEETTNRADSSNTSERNEVSESSNSQTGPTCQNGVCMVAWKPQRPVAA
ncbi:MAG TPA: hypothetical protein V6C76_17575 [Drouetiella sp.]